MSLLEINLYNILKTDFNLSDAKAMDFINSLEKLQEESIKSPIEELSSKMDKRIEELSSKMDKRFEQVDLKFEQINTKFEQVYTKIEVANGNTLKWFMGGFITIVLMVLGLYAAILLK